MSKFLIRMPCEGPDDSRRKWQEVVGASRGSPCSLDRAFVDPATGNTTCVWEAPSLAEVEALFAKAGVAVETITQVEEYAGAEN